MSVLISVILPVYNAQDYIFDAVSSILNQSYTNFEFIIIDDGSTDNSYQIINKIVDSRIKLIKNDENLGLIATLNKGLSLAKGELIARMDADDISLPDRFKTQYDYLSTHPEIDILGGNYEIFGTDNKIQKTPNNIEQIKIELYFNNCICHPSVMLRKQSIIDHKLIYDSNFLHNEDWYFWFNAIHKGLKITNIDSTLIKYRLEGQNITTKNKNSIKTRYCKLYKNILLSLFPVIDDKQVEIHWSLSHSEIGDFSKKELKTYIKILSLALINIGLNKKLVNKFISYKKNKLFYKYADKSAYDGFTFLLYNRIFKIKYLRYLASKI